MVTVRPHWMMNPMTCRLHRQAQWRFIFNTIQFSDPKINKTRMASTPVRMDECVMGAPVGHAERTGRPSDDFVCALRMGPPGL